jgi:hypothetical protein
MSFLGVTFSGIDENVDVTHLREIRSHYFTVEWGVWLSTEQRGLEPRFPKIDWVRKLDPELAFSAHLWGKDANDFLRGEDGSLLDRYGELWPLFRRLQINSGEGIESVDLPRLMDLMEKHKGKQITFRIRERNLEIADAAVLKGASCSVLFDQFGPQEVGQKKWPKGAKRFSACGYTGGLGPDNIYKQLSSILSAAQTAERWWVDMDSCLVPTETGSEMFSLESCRRVIREVDAYFLDYTI